MIEQHKLIDDYVKGLISNEDKIAFELELANDKDLQEEVNFRKAIVRNFKFDQIKQTIAQAKLENEKETETQSKLESIKGTIKQAQFENMASRQRRIKLYRNLSIAATFLVMIGGGWFWSINQNNNFLTNIIVSEAELQKVTTVNAAKIKSLVEKANQAIEEKKFNLVLSIADQLRNEEGFETDEILQNESYIYFKQKNYAKADRQIDRIKDAQLQNKVRWQLSNLYIDEGKTDLAKQQLQKTQEGSYKKKAIKKLKQLN